MSRPSPEPAAWPARPPTRTGRRWAASAVALVASCVVIACSSRARGPRSAHHSRRTAGGELIASGSSERRHHVARARTSNNGVVASAVCPATSRTTAPRSPRPLRPPSARRSRLSGAEECIGHRRRRRRPSAAAPGPTAGRRPCRTTWRSSPCGRRRTRRAAPRRARVVARVREREDAQPGRVAATAGRVGVVVLAVEVGAADDDQPVTDRRGAGHGDGRPAGEPDLRARAAAPASA